MLPTQDTIMRQKNLLSVTVRNTLVTKGDGVYFSRVVDSPDGDIDVNVILSAMKMLFKQDNFKISIETYGA